MAEQSLRAFLIKGIHEYEGHDDLAIRFSEEEAKKLVAELEKYNNPFSARYMKQDYEWKYIPGCEYRYSYDYIEYEEVEDNYFVECLMVRNQD